MIIIKECYICGRITKSVKAVNYKGNSVYLCQKHAHQWYEKGEITDTTPYSCMDGSTNEYIEHKDYYEIILRSATNDYKEMGRALIDKDDYKRCKENRWRYVKHTYKRKHGEIIRESCYTGSKTKNNMIALHRFIMNCTENDGVVVDHINGNPLDNRKSNLRICTQQNNIWNKTILNTNNTSGVSGVYKDNRKGRKTNWISEIKYNDVKIYLSAFENFEDAVYCRYYAEKLLFKEFSHDMMYNERKSYIDKCTNKQKIEDKVKQRIKIKLNMDL